ncbi:MAG: hypothetical protein SPJ29_03905 [Phocaeicola sp.]|nr:hypothetical protein [Prevotellaceae bacterium]MDY3913407.1 hypothetical protein [Phocaeicola sp.]MDY5938881.1 hypothetical protein [Phocaeicola sp.]
MEKKETYVIPNVWVITTIVPKSLLVTFSAEGNVTEYEGAEFDEF